MYQGMAIYSNEQRNTYLGNLIMTLQKATDLGWIITGTETDCTAEKGRLIHMGPMAFVLKLIAKIEGE